MPLPQALTRTPEAIEDISITLTDYVDNQAPEPGEGEPEPTPIYQTAGYSVQVKYNDGSIKVMTGDLVPHLTTARITSLKAFMVEIRTKAEEEILP